MSLSLKPARRVAMLVGLAASLLAARDGLADTVTACTTINLCYCINEDYHRQINDNIARVRQLIIEQRTLGKAIGYLSVPLSTAGGSYFGINKAMAKETKERIEAQLGKNSVWVLNPGDEGNLPAKASGADYMLMWTKILEGRSGLGEDFDFFYFVGASDFARFFKFDGNADMEKLDAEFDKRLASDAAFKAAVEQGKISKRTFVATTRCARPLRSATARMTNGISRGCSTSAAAARRISALRTSSVSCSMAARSTRATSRLRTRAATSVAASIDRATANRSGNRSGIARSRT
jgi:hypothetical protein